MEQANLDGYYIGITTVFGYSFLVASFILVLVAEKENKVNCVSLYIIIFNVKLSIFRLNTCSL